MYFIYIYNIYIYTIYIYIQYIYTIYIYIIISKIIIYIYKDYEHTPCCVGLSQHGECRDGHFMAIMRKVMIDEEV